MSNSATTFQLIQQLQSGLRSSRELQAALRLSQSRISKIICDADDTIVTVGAARSTRYGVRRKIRGQQLSLPLFLVTEGDAPNLQRVGDVIPLAPANTGEILVRGSDAKNANHRYEGFPYFLADAIPQGFLGRLFSQQHSELNMNPDVRLWSSDDIFFALAQQGHDTPGAWILGEKSAEQWLTLRENNTLGGPVIREKDRVTRYPELLRETMSGVPPGSSAGGEQPKFLCRVKKQSGKIRAVMVKFSPEMNTESGQRWADLLCAEHLAQDVLRENGVTAVETEIIQTQNRTFLEVTRFDRHGAFGRKPFVSFGALADMSGERSTWLSMARAFEREGWVTPETVRTVTLLAAFARCIHNTDTHPGNLSLIPSDDAVSMLGLTGVFSLAPVYDMLPMGYAPKEDNSCTVTSLPVAAPMPELLPVWEDAQKMALTFSERVATSDIISESFKNLWANEIARWKK